MAAQGLLANEMCPSPMLDKNPVQSLYNAKLNGYPACGCQRPASRSKSSTEYDSERLTRQWRSEQAICNMHQAVASIPHLLPVRLLQAAPGPQTGQVASWRGPKLGGLQPARLQGPGRPAAWPAGGACAPTWTTGWQRWAWPLPWPAWLLCCGTGCTTQVSECWARPGLSFGMFQAVREGGLAAVRPAVVATPGMPTKAVLQALIAMRHASKMELSCPASMPLSGRLVLMMTLVANGVYSSPKLRAN